MHDPQSSNSDVPFIIPKQSIHPSDNRQFPSQSKFSTGPSPPHTPHSSNSKVEPHVSSHPDGPVSPQPQPRSTLSSQSHAPSGIPSPPHTPHSSTTALPPHSSAQSNSTMQFPSQS